MPTATFTSPWLVGNEGRVLGHQGPD